MSFKTQKKQKKNSLFLGKSDFPRTWGNLISPERGFTLIELLVVISITSLLASIVFASLNTAREKAQIAAGQVFDGNVFRSIGDEALGIYNFETGAEAVDQSEYSNNLAFTAGVSFVDGIKGKALRITSGQSAYTNSVVTLTGGDWTISAWVKPTFASGVFLSSHVPYIGMASSQFRMYWTYPPAPTLVGGAVNVGKWHHVAGTFKKVGLTNTVVLYVNGKEVDSYVGNVVETFVTRRFCIGSHGDASNGVPCVAPNYIGDIDEVRVYKKSLLASEIQQLYAEGLPRHILADAD